jgi:hypothetical protein
MKRNLDMQATASRSMALTDAVNTGMKGYEFRLTMLYNLHLFEISNKCKLCSI